MKSSMVYVIKNGEEEYIAPRKTNVEWYFVAYSGDCEGFTFYTNENTAKKEMNQLNRIGNEIYLEYIDINLIPKGERLHKLTVVA